LCIRNFVCKHIRIYACEQDMLTHESIIDNLITNAFEKEGRVESMHTGKHVIKSTGVSDAGYTHAHLHICVTLCSFRVHDFSRTVHA
jgi:hypothetical protein